MGVSKHQESRVEKMSRMPVVFVGHGSPLNAIEGNHWSRSFAALKRYIPKPRAIVSISAHWYTQKTQVLSADPPRTIHDFGGFAQELFDVQYPARGDSDLVAEVERLVQPHPISRSAQWGLDHGTWSVLVNLYPEADIPTIQMSLDATLPLQRHIDLGKKLAPLREQGVLIFASGNVTHNLRDAFGRMGKPTETPPWAAAFDAEVIAALEARSESHLSELPGSKLGRLSHPSPDHYIPLLYAQGASQADDRITYPIQGWDMGSISMRAVLFGSHPAAGPMDS